LRQQIENTYNVPVVGILPESNDIIKLASNGVFYLKNRQHPIAKVIDGVADHIIKIYSNPK
jgi:septum site-determining protein MinD